MHGAKFHISADTLELVKIHLTNSTDDEVWFEIFKNLHKGVPSKIVVNKILLCV